MNYDLSTSLYRDEIIIEKEHIINNRIIQSMPNDFESCESFFDKLTLLKHFNCPSRLLDITKNPLIAAFFALDHYKDNKSSEYGAINLCFPKNFNHIKNSINSDSIALLSSLSTIPKNNNKSNVIEEIVNLLKNLNIKIEKLNLDKLDIKTDIEELEQKNKMQINELLLDKKNLDLAFNEYQISEKELEYKTIFNNNNNNNKQQKKLSEKLRKVTKELEALWQLKQKLENNIFNKSLLFSLFDYFERIYQKIFIFSKDEDLDESVSMLFDQFKKITTKFRNNIMHNNYSISDSIKDIKEINKINNDLIENLENNMRLKKYYFYEEIQHQAMLFNSESIRSYLPIDKDINTYYIVNPSLNNKRIRNQQGLFILIGAEKNEQGFYLKPNQDYLSLFEKEKKRTVLIINNKNNAFYNELDHSFGINKGFIYPELENKVNQIKNDSLFEYGIDELKILQKLINQSEIKYYQEKSKNKNNNQGLIKIFINTLKKLINDNEILKRYEILESYNNTSFFYQKEEQLKNKITPDIIIRNKTNTNDLLLVIEYK